MTTLSVQVMAHPQRANLVTDLVSRLDISNDQVTWDRKNDRWDTGRRAWQAIDQRATYGMVIQDDAVVCQDLVPALELALGHIPKNAIVSPFMGTRRPAREKIQRAVNSANEINASWIVMGPLNWGVAIVIPTWTIPEMVRWCDRQKYPNYDKRVGQFFRRVKPWKTWYTWPNLVDHMETPSLVGHGDGRVSHRFIGEDASALSLSWDGPVLDASLPIGMARDLNSFRGAGSHPRPERTVLVPRPPRRRNRYQMPEDST